jgi:hypothetical protein
VHHGPWYVVTGVWDLAADDVPDRDIPDMKLEVLRDGSWSEVKRAGRTGGTGAGGLVAIFVYEADDGEDYRFTSR